MRRCGDEACRRSAPSCRCRRTLIAVGPDLNLAWHFRCRVALPVIRPTARADERDAFVKSDGTPTTADRRRHRCVLPVHASQVDRWRLRASAGRHQHDRTDRQGQDRYRKNAHSAHPPRMPDRRSAVSALPAAPKPARCDDGAWRVGLGSASCWTIKAGSCCSRGGGVLGVVRGDWDRCCGARACGSRAIGGSKRTAG